MSTFLIISAVIVLGLVILKLLNEVTQLKNKLGNLQDELNKKIEADNVNKKQVQITSTTSDNNKSITKKKRITSSSKVVKPKSKEQETLDDNKSIHEIPSLNPFLYNAADFGEMRKGVVFNGKTYGNGKEDEVEN
jgi:predicted Holliday junction resolvase-like endonuclease